MRPKLLYIVTHPITVDRLLMGQLAHMQDAGFEVVVVSGPGEAFTRACKREGVRGIALPFAQDIAPLQDLQSWLALYKILGQEDPDIVNASTPKAGFLGMTAAWVRRVPVRIYLLRGLRLETEVGWRRRILHLTEKIAAACAHRIICVSESLQNAFLSQKLAPPHKLSVLGPGSSNGVDLARFTPAPPTQLQRLRAQLGLPKHAKVIGFVGRINHDKGIETLLACWHQLHTKHPNTRLLIVGWEPPHSCQSHALRTQLHTTKGVIYTGFVEEPAPYYPLMNVLAFPSKREGMPNAILEAAASGVPAVGFRVTGVLDAIQDGHTGTLVKAGDTAAFGAALEHYLMYPDHAKQHGKNARNFVQERFEQSTVWQRWEALYRELMNPQ